MLSRPLSLLLLFQYARKKKREVINALRNEYTLKELQCLRYNVRKNKAKIV